MHRLVIHKLGPISECELSCSQFMAFTGFQASGKSTIAKAVFFFRTIKNDIYSLAKERALEKYSLNEMNKEPEKGTLKSVLLSTLRNKFLEVFGSSWGMDNDMRLEYYFTSECYIKISLIDSFYSTPNYIWIDISPALSRFLHKNDDTLEADALGISKLQEQRMKAELEELFNDKYETIYIPAGRSMLTVFSEQLSYIYTRLNDVQRRNLDYCTRDYIERILNLKSEFANGLEKIYYGKSKISQKTINLALQLTKKVLRGKYYSVNGEERIGLDNDRFVKINFASSGQQEAVWILNLLFYYLVNSDPVLFIIEEPESHLFPESQKYITELISLIMNSGHSAMITTHSPYVLGTLNNLLYAAQSNPDKASDVAKIIPKSMWLNLESFTAWFVKNGIIENCIDDEIKLIQNERIDEISKTINQDFDEIFELQLVE